MKKLPEEIAAKPPKLRQATAEDCSLMFRLQHLDGAQLDEGDPEQLAKYEKYRNDFDKNKIQVIELGGVAVGRLRVVREDSIYIGGFQILPEYRGQGLGTAILDSLVLESEQSGVPITLEVFNDNTEAVKLYEKIGFVITEESAKQKNMRYQPFSALTSR